MSESHGLQNAKRRKPLSVWELPRLLHSVHFHRKGRVVAPKARPHFPGILAFVYRNRFAVASQIQRRFAEQMPSDRTARRHLAEMESLGYLDVAPTNNTSPLWPKVYFVTKRGVKRLQKAYTDSGKDWLPYVSDRRRSEGISGQHILHEIFTTEFLLMVWETVRKRDDLELLRIERRSLINHPAFRIGFAGSQTRLEPDGQFLYRQNGSGMMCCFVEIDTGTMSQRQLAEKFQRYQVWSHSEIGRHYLQSMYSHFGAKHPREVFRILLVNTSGKGGGHRAIDSERLKFVSRLPSRLRSHILMSCAGIDEITNRGLEHWNWTNGTGDRTRLF